MRALALIGSPSGTSSSEIVIVAQSYIGEWSKFPVAVHNMGHEVLENMEVSINADEVIDEMKTLSVIL